jgi:signal transduction histidine kinase
LSLIQGQIQRVGDIVRKLLDLTRRPQLHLDTLSLPHLLDELLKLWAPTLASHHIELSLDLPDEVEIQADRKQMEQLFINLVNNAMDAMPEGGRILLKVRADDSGFWRVEVQDNGAGIAEEHLAQVFRPMFTTKPEGKGTGLGLPICREIVRAHGGDIRIESQLGKGTTVSFTLQKGRIVEANA